MSWGVIKLSDAVDVMHQGINTAADKVVYVESGVPIIQSKHLKNDELNFTGVKYLNKSDADKYSEKYIPKLGDILFANIGTIGKSVIVKKQYDFMFAWNVFVIRPKKQVVDVGFLKYYLDRLLSVNYYDKFLTGGTVKFINKKVMGGIEIPLPYPEDLEKSLKEQKRIAAILDKADGIRRKRQQAIQLADDFLRSVFLDMFGDPVTNPKGWEVKPLKELSVKVSSGSTPKGGSKVYADEGIHFFRSQNVWKNDIRMDDIAFIDKETHASLKKSSLKHKDILMTKTGRFNTENSSLGRAALFLGKDDSANVNGHVYLIRLKEKVLHEFIVFILTSIEYREHIRNVCVGGIDKRQLNKDHIENFPIICPPEAMQVEFMKKLSAIHQMRESAKLGLKEAQPLFNTLSQKAFNGEL